MELSYQCFRPKKVIKPTHDAIAAAGLPVMASQGNVQGQLSLYKSVLLLVVVIPDQNLNLDWLTEPSMLQWHHCHPGLPLLPGCKGWRVMGCRGADGLGWFQKIQQLRLIMTADIQTSVNWTQAFLLWRYLAVATTKQDTHTMTTLPKDPKDPWQEKKFKPHGTTLATDHAWGFFMIYCEWRLSSSTHPIARTAGAEHHPKQHT